MNSLVAYDDSDSETDAGKSEDVLISKENLENPAMSATGSRDGFNTVSKSQIHSVDYMAGSKRNVFHIDPFLYHGEANNKSSAVVHPKKAYPAAFQMATCSPEQSFSPLLKPQVFSANESYSQKRTHEDSGVTLEGLRPYIPKRLRKEKYPEAETGEESTSYSAKFGVAGDGMSIKTSKYIMPYLGSEYEATEIPTNLVFRMSEHRGPVNVVQWCPEQKWSHMLLSASMDNTIKVWDAVDRGCCLKTYSCHSCAVRDARWSPSGSGILSGGFDSMLHLTDVETGAQVFSGRSEFRIGTLKFHPADPNVFICGGFSPEVRAWDMRICKAIKAYKAAVQQTLDIMFLPEGKEFLTSTDAVSQDSADRTIIAWDFQTGAKISNQIFHVEGFAVGCEFSPDGTLLVTGSSEGKVFFYSYRTARVARTLPAHGSACVAATFHPVLPSLLATCGWDGEIKIWQ
ncbi:WD repeat-containing protein 25 isoform X2 [Paroedura picta]|uniref:WD repeat-containing protein 25 isoform X2 n=1 Tax=Paroedura picta TaxID=143630 RepID=UPI004055D6E2